MGFVYSVSSKKITAMIFAGLKNKAEMASKNKIVVAMVSPPVTERSLEKLGKSVKNGSEVVRYKKFSTMIVGVVGNVWNDHPKQDQVVRFT